MSEPILRKINERKVNIVRWIDKQGNRSLSTYLCSTSSLKRFVFTNNQGVKSDYYVVESSEQDSEILSFISDNQVLAWGLIM